MLGLFCNDFMTSNCRPSIQNVSFCVYSYVSLVIQFLVQGCHLTLKRSRPLTSWQPILMCIYCALFLVFVTIMTALFHIMHKRVHYLLTCWPLGSIGTGTIYSSMNLSSWSMHYVQHLSWYYQTCVVSSLLRLMHLTTILVGFGNRTKVVVYSMLLITVRSSMVHHATMQPMSVSYQPL